MAELKSGGRVSGVKVASTGSAKQVDATQIEAKRSRWIVVSIVTVLLIAGAVMIAGRVLPYVNLSGGEDGLMGGSISSNMIGLEMPEIMNDDSFPDIENSAQVDMAESPMISKMMVAGSKSARGLVSSSDMMPPIGDDEAVPSDDSRVIRNGSLDIVVGNIDAAMTKVQQIAAVASGVIARSQFWNESGDSEQQVGTVTVRVPASQFDTTFDALKDMATEVSSQSTSTRDVTAEFVDLNAQLVNKKRQESRLGELFDKAEKVEDLLRIERELSRVRGEIERLEGRLRYMEARTDYSTITVNMREDVKVATVTERQWRPAVVARKAVNGLMSDVENYLSVAIIFLARFIPLFVLYALSLWIVWVIGKKVYQQFKTSAKGGLKR